MTHCSRCDAELSAWEVVEADDIGVTPCWCEGVPQGVRRTLANVAYSELCHVALAQPVKVHDVARFVEPNYRGNPRYSINGALSMDRRFCWGGRGLYGLARHALIPGARNLADAAYAVLLAAPRKLHVEEVDFVMEQLNYRFNSGSLLHHLRGYTTNRWGLRFHIDYSNRVWVNSGRDDRHSYNSKVWACPTDAGFDAWIEAKLAPRVSQLLDERIQRLAAIEGDSVRITGDHIEFS